MRPTSIASRVVTVFLLVELISALCMTGCVFLYERQSHFRSLDVALLGRADSLMGAVVDAEDADDRVVLDLEGLHLPADDLYEVWDNQQMLGRSPGWTAPPALVHGSGREGEARDVTLNGSAYRTARITGLRVVDPAQSNVRHSIVIVYASPARAAWRPVLQAVRAFALASIILLAGSAFFVSLLVKRSMQPLENLATEAGRISSSRWRFTPGRQASETRELVPLIAALDDLVQRLQLSFAQQRQFVSDSAHELKTAVTVVKSSLQLLELRERNAEQYRAGLASSLRDCQRMEELVHRMLTLARIEESGRLATAATEVAAELHEGSLASIDSLTSLARLRGVSLRYSGPQQLWAVIHPDDWQTLCTNLLLNAIQHSQFGTQVRLSLAAQGHKAVLEVADHGEGIASDALPYVFDRFYRSDASRARSTGGTGLGLAIVRAIVDRVQGRISIESVEGQGTSVTVALTLTSPPRPRPGTATELPQPEAMASSASRLA